MSQPLPYFPISQFYRAKFGGEKVYKISVSIADTCPNREGLRGMQTCNFCDQWGSAAYAENLEKPLPEQIEYVRDILVRKREAKTFLVYFQAYTTTFARVHKLREAMRHSLTYDDVVGLVLGTRPDCLSDALFDTLREMVEQRFVSVELGVQSFSDEQLKWMRRGHTAADSLRALERLQTKVPGLDLGIHLIFGLPGETEEEVVRTALRVNELGVQNVKLHHMHVLKNTPLEEDYKQGLFKPMEQERYFHHTMLFLQHLKKDIAVQRLSAFAPRWDELVAPAWTTHKMKTYQDILTYMRTHGAYQGQALEL